MSNIKCQNPNIGLYTLWGVFQQSGGVSSGRVCHQWGFLFQFIDDQSLFFCYLVSSQVNKTYLSCITLDLVSISKWERQIKQIGNLVFVKKKLAVAAAMHEHCIHKIFNVKMSYLQTQFQSSNKGLSFYTLLAIRDSFLPPPSHPQGITRPSSATQRVTSS